ncbi:ABC transporter substrate-binding protein [Cryptosporangium phraense]|uniref:ABC transporter substrate-binding protein n=1 Tax=Cryptosporangium phraense TaxID=2593070 RepID=A0A545AMP0_9ACTN|nr:ABC transporter substrate-binding protein [Cryptosporangium phraense]TQS42530.1 ABC transporter substrate-binding protein [Cryptosporangium phraense]
MNRSRKVVVAALALVLAVAGCNAKTEADDGDDAGFAPPKLSALSELGTPEGALSVLAWAGYAEDGSNDPSIDWVTPFEHATGCQVTVKVFNTSDEAVTLMKTGKYDVVSASGDASLRLIGDGTVEPVNTDLVPNYVDIYSFLKNQRWNSVDDVSYGIPHGWGANLLMYRKDAVHPAPTSWSAVFAPSLSVVGKVTAYDSPIYIADAALWLMRHQPDLGITNPYALDDKQFAAAIAVLEQQKASVSEYWSDYAENVAAFKAGDSIVGTSWQVIENVAKTEGVDVEAVLPSEGSTGWSDTWMLSAKSKHKTCAYKWFDHIVSPQVNAQVAEYFGEAPSNPKACRFTTDPQHCAVYHANDAGYAKRIWYWSTPLASCLDGRTGVRCKDYEDWAQAWTTIKG